jgi:hypothetical protein
MSSSSLEALFAVTCSLTSSELWDSRDFDKLKVVIKGIGWRRFCDQER